MNPLGYSETGVCSLNFRSLLALFDVFRADVLDSVLYRVGLLAALRSKNLGGKAIGVMVTASHNPERVRPPLSPLEAAVPADIVF